MLVSRTPLDLFNLKSKVTPLCDVTFFLRNIIMSIAIDPNKIVVFSGAGISVESGIKTFRDNDELWKLM